VEPIKRDFGLSDTEFSLLHGLAFAIFYTLLGLPIGRLMDTSKRTRLISAGVALWSLMCAGCGVVQSFWGMFACRLGIGVGEATLSPGAYSLISDYFPPARRARALATYSLGITVGGGLAFAFGGVVVDIAATQQGTILPLLGEVASWQLVFIAVGLPGLIVALMVLSIREPQRREQLIADDGSSDVSIADIRRFLGTHARLFFCLFVGLGLISIASYALTAWIPTTFIRRFAWTAGEIGLAYGLIMAVIGSLGLYGGAWYSDWLAQHRGDADAPLRVILYGIAGALIFGSLSPVMPTASLCIGMLACANLFILVPFGLAPVMLQAVVPNQMRGVLSAVYLFVMNILGLGIGPTSVALVTDRVFGDELMVGWSISLVLVLVLPVALLLMAVAIAPYRAARAEFQKSVDSFSGE
ncbi:MAG: MFS transporter, partial [Chromatocurvus sp.]